MELVNDPWPTLFREATGSAVHLETRDAYAVPAESEPLRRFLAGEPRIIEDDPWARLMRETTGRGVTVSRVRVVSVPHSDYHRWLLSETTDNLEAGELIRYLPRPEAGEVPRDDWWLFDDRKVAFNLVNDNGRPAGAAVTTDPGVVDYCRRAMRRLWSLATPYTEYVAR